MQIRFYIVAIFILFASLILGAGNTHAQTEKYWRPFAPWISLEGTATSATPQPALPRAYNAGRKSNRAFAMATNTPNIQQYAPEDTLELIEQIYDRKNAPSVVEEAYSRRIVDELEQFGYDVFFTPEKTDKEDRENDVSNFTMPAGAVQDDFVLGIGDKLEITFRGQRLDQKKYEINSQGLLIVDEFPPVAAAGRTIKQLEQTLQAHADTLYNTDIYIALASVKQINVLVLGNVTKPGRQNLTVFHTVIDALMAAGGIDKTGSLRRIKLVRNGRSTYVDLYGLLVHGSSMTDLSLRDGDRVVVPPIGPTVAIAGGVTRPGIYETLPAHNSLAIEVEQGAQKLSLQEMLTLAGGVLSPGKNRFIKLGLTNDGRETVEEVGNDMIATFDAGSILMVSPAQEMRTGTVELVGHTRHPGLYDLDKTSSLSALLADDKVFGPNVYPLIGVVDRRDKGNLSRKFIDFPPLMVAKGQFDQKLQDGDVVMLFSREEIMALQKTNTYDDKDMAKAERKNILPAAMGSTMAMPYDETSLVTDPALTSFLAERAAFIRGAVRHEGAWPVAHDVTLESLISTAGGLTLEASTHNIEVTTRRTETPKEDNGLLRRINVDLTTQSPVSVQIGPGDTVRIKQKFKRVADNSVLIIGEVQNPGHYDLMPGDKLSDLLQRANGLTAQSYPDGTIFSRESERKAEEARFRAQARDLEVKLASALEQKDEPDTAQIYAVQDIITQLKQAEAVGRITVEANPAALEVRPELDILLQAGDRIYIPKRPLTVRVAGEVLSPASLQFRKEKDAKTYIMESGGFTYHADKDRAFVVYPDGSAKPLSVSLWSYDTAMIPPGSTIVVPRDPKPFDFIETARDMSQILSNLAITGIFIDDITDD